MGRLIHVQLVGPSSKPDGRILAQVECFVVNPALPSQPKQFLTFTVDRNGQTGLQDGRSHVIFLGSNFEDHNLAVIAFIAKMALEVTWDEPPEPAGT